MLRMRKLKKGFTLVELLVVIAIIGILMGLMAPAIAKVRALAHSTYCKNNLKELGVAFNNYATDNGDFMPYVAVLPGLVIPDGFDSLYNYLHPFTNSDKVFKCPADRGASTPTVVAVTYYDESGNLVEGSTTTAASGEISDFDYNKSSYEFNEFLGGRRLKLLPRAMLMHDYRTYHGLPGAAGAMNFLFGDGHVGDWN